MKLIYSWVVYALLISREKNENKNGNTGKKIEWSMMEIWIKVAQKLVHYLLERDNRREWRVVYVASGTFQKWKKRLFNTTRRILYFSNIFIVTIYPPCYRPYSKSYACQGINIGKICCYYRAATLGPRVKVQKGSRGQCKRGERMEAATLIRGRKRGRWVVHRGLQWVERLSQST